MSEIMSFTCLSWHTTGATFHYAKRVQKCAQNCRFWSFWPFLAILALFFAIFGPFWAVFEEKKCLKSCHLPVFHGTLQGQPFTMQKECRNVLKMAIFGDFGLFLAVFDQQKCRKSCHLPVFHGTLLGQPFTMQKECRNVH